jgi:hypothetical protein
LADYEEIETKIQTSNERWNVESIKNGSKILLTKG